jgi:hypothetical protein
MTQPEGQTSRDIFPEDDGIPEVSQDDFPTQDRAEDPQFAPVPGDRPTAALDYGTTAFEQSEGESLSGRLDREIPHHAPDALRSSSRTSTRRLAPTPAPSGPPTTSRPRPTHPSVARGRRSLPCTSRTADQRSSLSGTNRPRFRGTGVPRGRVGASAIGCLRLRSRLSSQPRAPVHEISARTRSAIAVSRDLRWTGVAER